MKERKKVYELYQILGKDRMLNILKHVYDISCEGLISLAIKFLGEERRNSNFLFIAHALWHHQIRIREQETVGKILVFYFFVYDKKRELYN